MVAACCRWPPSDDRVAAVQEAAAHPLDWRRVLRIANRHRVEGLTHNGLADAGVILFRADRRGTSSSWREK